MNSPRRFWIFLIWTVLPLNVLHARAIGDVLQNAGVREKVFIEGRIKRAFDFDTFLVSDEKSDIAVSFLGVRQDLKVGDVIAVYGRFRGRLSYKSAYGLLETLEWAPQNDPASAALREKYDVTAASTPVAAVVPCIFPAPTIETRLKQLEDLKSKKLISEKEYQEQRKRILNDL